jgi:hypothetical protein
MVKGTSTFTALIICCLTIPSLPLAHHQVKSLSASSNRAMSTLLFAVETSSSQVLPNFPSKSLHSRPARCALFANLSLRRRAVHPLTRLHSISCSGRLCRVHFHLHHRQDEGAALFALVSCFCLSLCSRASARPPDHDAGRVRQPRNSRCDARSVAEGAALAASPDIPSFQNNLRCAAGAAARNGQRQNQALIP